MTFTAHNLERSVGLPEINLPHCIEIPTEFTCADGVRLRAIWTEPKVQRRGVAVILQGSGNVSEDGDVSGELVGTSYNGAPPLLSRQLGHELAKTGIASV